MPGPTQVLAAFTAGLTWDDLPNRIRSRAADILLDTIACAYAGRDSLETAQITKASSQFGGTSGSVVVGAGQAPMLTATMINAYQVTAGMLCDIHRPTLCHVTPEVVPPALAIAQRSGASGRDLLLAVVAGLETTVRVGYGIHYPYMRSRGWHSAGVIGPFGGAAAGCRLLGVAPERTVNAFALAGGQSCGTFAQWGTPAIKFHQARGAVSGLLSALLASTGFEASDEILTHPHGGILAAYSDGGDPERILSGLGDRWDFETISLRRWPVASSIQSIVTALLALVEVNPIDPSRVVGMTIGLSPTVAAMHGDIGWEREFEAMLSARYTAAVVLHDRRCWFEQFSEERLRDLTLSEFARDRVKVEVDDTIDGVGAVVEVELDDSTTYIERREVPLGDAADPLGRQDIAEKFYLAAEMAGVEKHSAEEMVEAVLDIASASDLSRLWTLLAEGHPNSRGSDHHSQAAAQSEGVTSQIADFASSLDLESVPQAARSYAKRILLDTVACALAADLGDEVESFGNYAAGIGGSGQSTVVGADGTLSIAGSTLLGAWRITAVSVCDIYSPARVHITPELVPPLLAVAEADDVSGEELLTALIVGLEVAIRVADGIGYDPTSPWHLPGIVGPFGSAAAIGRLREFDSAMMRDALGLAGSQSAGTWADWGTAAVKFHQVAGAFSGLIAALLAETGFDSSSEVLTDRDGGLFYAFSDGGKPDAVIADLGKNWLLEDLTLRMWPGPVFMHPPIVALREILSESTVRIDEVEELRVVVSPFVYDRLSYFVSAKGTFDALISVGFAMGVILEGSTWLDALRQRRHLDPRFAAFFEEKVVLVSDEEMGSDTARVEIDAVGHDRLVRQASLPPGRASEIIGEEEIADKFRMCARDVLEEAESELLLHIIFNLEDQQDLSEFFSLLRGRATNNSGSLATT